MRHKALLLLNAPHSAERILRCWGAESHVTFTKVRDSIGKLLKAMLLGTTATYFPLTICLTSDLYSPFFSGDPQFRESSPFHLWQYIVSFSGTLEGQGRLWPV